MSIGMIRLGSWIGLGFICALVAGAAHADGFRDAMMSVPAEPTAADRAAFVKTWQGTWAADFESRAGYAEHMDVVDGNFLLVRTDMTRTKSSAGTNTMIRRWQPGMLQRVPIDGWTRESFAAVAMEDRDWYKTHDNKRRKADVGALMFLRYGKREWVHGLIEQAKREGVREIWTAELNLETPRALQYGVEDLASMRGWEAYDNSEMWVVLAGDRVYVGNRADRDKPLYSYRRRATLGADVDPNFDGARKHRLEREYAEWRGRCDLLRDAGLAADAIATCDAFRDSYVKLGLARVDNRDLRRKKADVVESAAEEAFWKGASMRPAVEHQPYLDYCNLGLTGTQQRALYQKLGERNFERTAWLLRATVLEKESSWDRETFLRRSSALMGWKRNLWLREDGVIGIQDRFDDANRWSVEDRALVLRFGDLTIRAPFGSEMMPVVDNRNATHLANYDLELVANHYELYRVQERMLDRDHPHYAEIVAEIESRKCGAPQLRANASGAARGAKSGIAKSAKRKPVPPPVIDKSAKQSQERKPARAKQAKAETKKDEPMPHYWHMRVEPAHKGIQLPANLRAVWDQGFYIYLRENGDVGFNTKDPGPYFYEGAKTWKHEGQRLTIALDGVVYAFELPTKYGMTLTALDTARQDLKMLLYPKSKGQR